jgi:hypothetical protein
VRERSDTQEQTAWERERALFMMLLQDREHQIQDLRQERDAWQQQAVRTADALVDRRGEERGAKAQAVVALGETIARYARRACPSRWQRSCRVTEGSAP